MQQVTLDEIREMLAEAESDYDEKLQAGRLEEKARWLFEAVTGSKFATDEGMEVQDDPNADLPALRNADRQMVQGLRLTVGRLLEIAKKHNKQVHIGKRLERIQAQLTDDLDRIMSEPKRFSDEDFDKMDDLLDDLE